VHASGSSELGGTAIHAQLSSRLAESAPSLSTVQQRLQRFEEGDPLCKFLAKCPFASVRVMSKHFGVSASTVKEILICELGFRKNT
jgi:hypothetical protein